MSWHFAEVEAKITSPGQIPLCCSMSFADLASWQYNREGLEPSINLLAHVRVWFTKWRSGGDKSSENSKIYEPNIYKAIDWAIIVIVRSIRAEPKDLLGTTQQYPADIKY